LSEIESYVLADVATSRRFRQALDNVIKETEAARCRHRIENGRYIIKDGGDL